MASLVKKLQIMANFVGDGYILDPNLTWIDLDHVQDEIPQRRGQELQLFCRV